MKKWIKFIVQGLFILCLTSCCVHFVQAETLIDNKGNTINIVKITYRMPLQTRGSDRETVQPDKEMLNAFNGLHYGAIIIYPEMITTQLIKAVKNVISDPLCYVIFIVKVGEEKKINDKAKEWGLKEIKVKNDLPTTKLKEKYDMVMTPIITMTAKSVK